MNIYKKNKYFCNNIMPKSYSNFVRASSPERCTKLVQNTNNRLVLSGEEARKLYLEEVKHVKSSDSIKRNRVIEHKRKPVKKQQEVSSTNKDLFITVQNNDVDTLKCVLYKYPDKINVVDDYGWSLLMIACQANSIDVVKVLLKKGIDISVRDKAGNSARSLVVKNRNYILADVLQRYSQKDCPINSKQTKIKLKQSEELFTCEICNQTYSNREHHLSSILHNINASKGKKIPANYVLPETNRGYQLMLKGGWDKQSGLGRDGSGKLYPIKTIQKKDRKGLGNKNRKSIEISADDNVKHKNRKNLTKNHQSNKSFEINFRREFY